MEMKKGFTLVEIIAVIAVLAVIMLVTAPTVLRTLKKSEGEEYTTYLENLYLATETYVQQNRDTFPQLEVVGGKATIAVRTLQEQELVKQSLQNPKTKAVVNPNSIITVVVESDGTYKYDYIEG